MLTMTEKMYSHRLGIISDAQFQAALDRFNLGRFIQAEAIPFGNFGQNVFVSSTTGEYVFRGQPHFEWQFPTEQFFVHQLHERTSVPVPWPYLVDATTDIFGWSFVIMSRMSGLQLADSQVVKQLEPSDRRGIAYALGENLAEMQDLTWPIAGRYNTATHSVEPFERAQSFPAVFDVQLTDKEETLNLYTESVKEHIHLRLTDAQRWNATATTPKDIAWVEQLIAKAEDALKEAFEPCFLMRDYKEGNLVVTKYNKLWRVSGVFDLMEGHFGDGEADLSRQIGEYLNEDSQLAGEFFAAYRKHKPLRPGFAQRFPVYMLLDRVILWEFFQHQGWRWWPEHWTFRDWASQYTFPDIIFGQL